MAAAGPAGNPSAGGTAAGLVEAAGGVIHRAGRKILQSRISRRHRRLLRLHGLRYSLACVALWLLRLLGIGSRAAAIAGVLNRARRRDPEPQGVRNIGASDVVVIDFPTAPYNHEDPDKYRLPIDTPLIPYSFTAARGW